MYLGCHTSLLPFIFMVFRIVVIQLNYGRPKYVIKLSEFDHSQFWESRNVNRSISSTKLQLCSLSIICNTMSFIAKFTYFCFPLYPPTPYLCKHSVRFSLVGLRWLESHFFVPLTLIFALNLSLWRAIFHCYHWDSFRSEVLPSDWMIDIPIWQLNLSIRFTNEFQEREINATVDVYRHKRHIAKTNAFVLVSSEHMLVSWMVSFGEVLIDLHRIWFIDLIKVHIVWSQVCNIIHHIYFNLTSRF
jgi:hypothetical protein